MVVFSLCLVFFFDDITFMIKVIDNGILFWDILILFYLVFLRNWCLESVVLNFFIVYWFNLLNYYLFNLDYGDLFLEIKIIRYKVGFWSI